MLSNFTCFWRFGIFREFWISRSRCNSWCSLRAEGLHNTTSASWFACACTGSAFHKRIWSNYTFRKMEIVGNSRKRSDTVGTMIRLNLSNPHFFNNRYFICFWKVQRCPKGNGWKRLETVGAPTFARSKRRKAHFR